MRKNKIFTVAMMAFALMSCGNATKSNDVAEGTKDTLSVDSVQSQPDSVVVSPLKDEAKVKAFLQDFYDKYVFQTQKGKLTYEEAVQTFCTPELQKYLSDKYEYECTDGPCYDQTSFRSDAQDGPSEEYKVVEIIPEGEDWYKVTFLDMGNRGSVKIHCVAEGDALKMSEIKKK